MRGQESFPAVRRLGAVIPAALALGGGVGATVRAALAAVAAGALVVSVLEPFAGGRHRGRRSA
jgi:hypothetical protein